MILLYSKIIYRSLHRGKCGLINKMRKQFEVIIEVLEYWGTYRVIIITIVLSTENIKNVIVSTLVWAYTNTEFFGITDEPIKLSGLSSTVTRPDILMLVNSTILKSVI